MTGKRIPALQASDQRCFNPASAAEYLGIELHTLTQYRAAKLIEARDLGDGPVYLREELDRFIQAILQGKVAIPGAAIVWLKQETRTAGIYFIEAPTTGLIKIGRSAWMEARIGSLNTGSAEDFILVGTWPTTEAIRAEKLFHEVFRDRQVKREWFRITETEITAALRRLIDSGELS